MRTDEESPIKHKTKSLRKLAAAALLFAVAAPLHAATPAQTLGFTEAGGKPPFIARKDLSPDAAGGGAREFRLDLHFGANIETVLGIAPLIHYNSNKIAVIGLSNIAHAGFIMPNPLSIVSYESDTPPAITLHGESVSADANRVMPLTWMDMNEIGDVAGATMHAPARIITIAFQWKAGATGNARIGITQSEFGNAHEFQAAGIVVQGANVQPPPGAFSWDVDSNGRITTQDGIMTARYLLGVRGAALVAGQSNAHPDEVAAHLKSGMRFLDVNESDAEADGVDGVLISRYFLGLRGDALMRNAGASADAEKVERNIKRFLP